MKRILILACWLFSVRFAAAATPPYTYARAWIGAGHRSVTAAHSRIDASSLVFLTATATDTWDPHDLRFPGVRIDRRGAGTLTVSTLNGRTVTGLSGLPVSYLVVNQPSGTLAGTSATYTTGTGMIAANTYNIGITASAARADSTILLTVDGTGVSAAHALPGLKINNKGNGWFTVTTLGLDLAPAAGLKFNWMVVNGGGGQVAGTTMVPAGVYNVGVTAPPTRSTSAVFLTVDATQIPGPDVALSGVKVNNHGDGWFTVTTLANTLAPASGVPFDWLVVDLAVTSDHLDESYFGDEYTIEVRTGNIPDGGTNANVYIRLASPFSSTGALKLDYPDRNDFERGAVNDFVISARMATAWDWVTSIEIWHDNTSDDAGWYLSFVKVRNDRTGRTKLFTFKRWLAKNQGDGAIHLSKPEPDDSCAGDGRCGALTLPDVISTSPPPPRNECPGHNVFNSYVLDIQPRADSGPIQYAKQIALTNHTGTLTSIKNTSARSIGILTPDGSYHWIDPNQTVSAAAIFGGNVALPVTLIAIVSGSTAPANVPIVVYFDCT